MNEKLEKTILNAGGRLIVRSALNPVLWFCTIIFVPTMSAIAIRGGDPPIYLLVLLFAPVVTVIIGFLFLLFFDRDKLQSEDYQIKKQSLALVYQKGEQPSRLSLDLEASSDPQSLIDADER
jgi:hypothetical protein